MLGGRPAAERSALCLHDTREGFDGMPVVFCGIDERLPGGLLLPADGDGLLRVLDGLPAGALVAASPGGESTIGSIRRFLRAGVRRDVRLVEVPLSRSALAMTAAVMSYGIPAGAVRDVAAGVSELASTVVLLDTVSALDRPAPSVAQHAAGLLPGTRFVVDVTRGRVHKCGRSLPASVLPQGVAAAVTACGEDRTSNQWREQLEAGVRSTNGIRLSTGTGSLWRARSWAEVTAVTEPLDAFARRLAQRLDLRYCHWCREVVSGFPCLYCGVGSGSAAATTPTPGGSR
ncbi:MAG: hypothetical protein GXX79_14660 [Actinomycetales bacterium]|nr:hypothetical protein [Actinomycetales bacterium]